ncbi:alpha/beta-hydrolase N-terminal domain-containing protein [Mesorhizobium sp.]|uniref:alpha/beta-hydrolase N-terminal domain-containing protein n=1 Tax=Mesorhizobium sp. TaxID=1871066 RepID=UPI00338FF39D
MRLFWIFRFWRSFSAAGLLIGTLFFAASLTPTLLPRTFVTQGVLSGCSFAADMGLACSGAGWPTTWSCPSPRAASCGPSNSSLRPPASWLPSRFSGRLSEWQNSIRQLMRLEPVDTAHPLKVGLIALLTFVLLILLARLFQVTFLFISGDGCA